MIPSLRQLPESDCFVRYFAFHAPKNGCYVRKLVIIAMPSLTDAQPKVIGHLTVNSPLLPMLDVIEWIEVDVIPLETKIPHAGSTAAVTRVIGSWCHPTQGMCPLVNLWHGEHSIRHVRLCRGGSGWIQYVKPVAKARAA